MTAWQILLLAIACPVLLVIVLADLAHRIRLPQGRDDLR